MSVHFGLSLAIQLSPIISDYTGLSLGISGYLWLSLPISSYLGLSQAIWGYIYQAGAGESKLWLFETFSLFFFPTGSIEELALLKIKYLSVRSNDSKFQFIILIRIFK